LPFISLIILIQITSKIVPQEYWDAQYMQNVKTKTFTLAIKISLSGEIIIKTPSIGFCSGFYTLFNQLSRNYLYLLFVSFSQYPQGYFSANRGFFGLIQKEGYRQHDSWLR